MVEPLDSHHHVPAAPLPHALDLANIREIEVFSWVGHENRTITDLSMKIPALITHDNSNKTKQLRSPSSANGLDRTRFLTNKNKDAVFSTNHNLSYTRLLTIGANCVPGLLSCPDWVRVLFAILLVA